MKALEAKVVVLGSRGVGKTSLVSKFVHNKCSKELEPTIGASFFVCKMYVEDIKVKLHIWDTAGQERFKAVAPMYYRNANAAVLVFDLCQYLTFYDLKSWVQELHRNVQEPIVLILVGNKLDLEQSRSVSRDEAFLYASSIGAKYFETSAEQHIGLTQVFLSIANGLLHLEKDNKSDTLRRYDSDDSITAYGNAVIEHSGNNIHHYNTTNNDINSNNSNNNNSSTNTNYYTNSNFNHNETISIMNSYHRHNRYASSHSIHLPAVQMGIPVDNHDIKANDTGRLETASWSIDYIAHGDEERTGWCC